MQNMILHDAATFSYMVACGEMLVGAVLILGLFTGIAAFFGSFLNVIAGRRGQQYPAAVHSGDVAGAGLARGEMVGPGPLDFAALRRRGKS